MAAAFLFAWCTTHDMKDITCRLYRVNAFLIVLVILFLLTGVLSWNTYVIGSRFRGTLGFLNPNAASLFYVSVIYFFLLSRKTVKLWHLVVGFAYHVIILGITDSRTAFVAISLFLVSIPFFKRKSFSAVFILFSKVSIILLWFGSALSMLFIDSLLSLDTMLSYRISYFMQLMQRADVENYLLGGTNFTGIVVDNFYYTFLFQYGILFYVFTALLLIHIVWKSSRNQNFTFLAFLVSVSFMGLMESSFIRPEILFALLVWKAIYDPISIERGNA